MENFYNYEQVLNALKVEYVNARNLKKVANSAKRATKNAASFSNRKVNEKTTLENRVDSIESVMDSTLSNAINEADQKKWTDLKSKLSELKGKLKNIENGEYLLVQSTLINPLDLNNQYEEVSTMDSSSFNMLKNLLNTAINDAETAINAAYSTDYNTLSQATIIRYGESELSNNQIMAKYLEKKSTLESLFQKAESAIDEYVNDIFSEVDGVKGREGDCVSQSRTLSYKKDELATLLVNEGSQSDIDQKELEIESIKQLMIQHANELKLAKIKLEQKAEDRFKIVAEYIEDARDYADEDFYQFINQNQYFLRDTGEPNIAELTDYRTGNLYSSLFDKLAQSTQIQGISESEYTQFKNEVDNARTNLMGLNNIIIRNVLRDQTLEYPQNLIEEVGDGKFEFKSYVPTNDIKFYKDYNRALHIQTSEYIIRKADRDSKRIELRDMVFTEAGSVINKMQQTYTDIRDTKWHLRKAHKFHKLNTELYTGTQEQQSAYNDFISEHNQAFYLFNQTEQTYQYNQATYQFNLGIFENEFNLLNTLTTTKTSTEDYLSTLSSSGGIDSSFAYGSGFDADANSVAIQSDGKILVGGEFTSYNGTSANKIIRLNSDGSIDTSFIYGTGFDNDVTSIAIQSDGKILVGGYFFTYNGTFANRIIRLNSDGSVDTSFVIGTGFDSDVDSTIVIQSDGKILVGGSFTDYNGTPANYIIRLNSDGSVDTSFVYGTGLNGYTKSFAIQSDGKIVVAGQFQSYNGTSANFIIRLNSDGDEAYPEALISRNAAIEEYNLFLDTKFGEEWFGLGLNQFTTGQLLLDMKNARDTSYASYAAAETAWNTELAEFEVLKSQMTLEEVDDFYKKEGIRSAHDISNAEDRLANLENRESGLQWHLVQIGNQATIMITNSPGSFREVSDAQFEESQLASLLGGVKNFLDSENNLLAINKKEIHSKESLKRKLEREMEGMQMGRPMNPSLPQGVFGAASAGESLLFSSEPYQWKNQLMSGINNIIIRFNPDSFADAIIAEATNGTRWW